MHQAEPTLLVANENPLLKGLHIVANLQSAGPGRLFQSAEFKKFIDHFVETIELTKVGEAYHDFEGGGFTGVVCLAESHLSVHTWPQHNYITFDVFLSNFSQDNGPKAKAIYGQVIKFFEAKILFENTIQR